MEQRILVLGSGLVARPLIRYLLGRGHLLTVTNQNLDRAQELIGVHPNGRAVALEITDEALLNELIGWSDLVVSLLPFVFHASVARRCLSLGKHLVTTSYVSNEMRELGPEAERLGLVFLNETGLDPGLDHMSAMRIIRAVHERGGLVHGFRSFCGGLPAPQANDNPWGYKFSWSPRGVLLAGRNSARFMMNGSVVEVDSRQLFANPWKFDVDGPGELEGYANRNSLQYVDLYGLRESTTMLRGTLRYPGWCAMMKLLGDLGWLSLDPIPGENSTLGGITAALIRKPTLRGDELRRAAGAFAGIAPEHNALERLAWAGLFDEVRAASAESVLDVLAARLQSLLVFKPGESDMSVMVHQFDIEEADGTRTTLVSSLVDFGEPDGDSSMARTVSLPAALGAELILAGRVAQCGVIIPIEAEICEPILDAMEEMGIRFVETRIS